MSGWTWFVRGYYNAAAEPPKQPGELAIEVGGKSRNVLDVDMAILRDRPDIGRVELLGPFYPPRRRP